MPLEDGASQEGAHKHCWLGLCGNCWREEMYKAHGEPFVLIRSSTQDQDPNTPDSLLLVKKNVVNGVLKVVSKQTGSPIQRGPMNHAWFGPRAC